jgi:glyoxylase-like metal-dependent hydrolase (beta-lactamase superfamily II)/rhodanese-related sulfurtransferase
MYFKQILNEEAGCSSYVIASRQSNEAVIVDPSYEIDHYLELARSRNFTVRFVIDTHIHADHVSGARKVAAATGAQLCMHGSADVLFPFRGLADGERINLGELLLDVMHTPGHRPELISLLVTNPPRADEPSLVLTGDSLFVGDVGRPDFAGPAGAAEQYTSVHRLLELPDYVEVFPAHFEGSCGKGMCGRPSSTIGFERRFNPMLQLSEADFIKAASDPPARPLNMTAIVAHNRGEADYGFADPQLVEGVRSISAPEASAWLERERPMVLDVREPWEFARGRLPGAVSLPQADLALHLNELDKERDYLVVCAGGVRSLRAAHYLRWAGFERAVSLEGGTEGWLRAGYAIERDVADAVPAPLASSTREPEHYFHAVE